MLTLEDYQDIQFSVAELPHKSIRITKPVKDERYLIESTKTDNRKWWIVSKEGVQEYMDYDSAAESFLSRYKVPKAFNLVRKSSHQVLAANKAKVASIIKKSSSYYKKDEWIDHPDSLVIKSSRELWALSKDGKYVARLFDESKFPLEV